MLTDKSTIGIGVIVQLTMSVELRGPLTVKLLVKLPIALTLTKITIVALDLAEILVKAQVTT